MLLISISKCSNRLFLSSPDVLNVSCCYQPVPCELVTSCNVARSRVELMGVCVYVCVCGSPVLVVASAVTVAISIKNEYIKKIDKVVT